MSDVIADLDAGLLRMRRAVLLTAAALADPSDGAVVDDDDRAELERAGLAVGAQLHPQLEVIARTVRNPVVELRLDLQTSGRRAVCSGWIDAGLAVLAVPGEGGLEAIKVAPTKLLPVRLAAFVGLGPRPVGTVESAKLEDFEHSMGSFVRLRWKAEAFWKAGQRSMEVIDAGDQGLWGVSRLDNGGEVWRASATEVWRGLVTLLPDDNELKLPTTDVSSEN